MLEPLKVRSIIKCQLINIKTNWLILYYESIGMIFNIDV